MKSIFSLIISVALVVSGHSQTRNVLVGTNNTIVQPTNFWSADASNARTGLGLGSAATNPASAFQPYSSVLSNLASSNAINLTNVRATNIVGIIPSSNISTLTLTNISGTLAITSGGTGATNVATARTNLGLDWPALTNTNAATSLLGFTTNGQVVAATNITFTNSIVTFQNVTLADQTLTLSHGSEDDVFIKNESGNLELGAQSNVVYFALENSTFRTRFDVPIYFNNTTNAATTRTNLGLGAIWLTNTNVTNFRTAIGLGSTNTVQLDSLSAKKWTIPIYSSGDILVGSNTIAATSSVIEFIHFGTLGLSVAGEEAIFNGYITNGKGITVGTDAVGFTSYGISFASNNTGGAAITRTNLGIGATWLTNTNVTNFRSAIDLGWSALTNSNAGTGLVSVNTNGEVVSPTNFWQVAPISTTVQHQTNVTATSTNAATNSRNLFLFSLAPTVSGITNTVTLPTNTATTFEGDRATIVHLATNSANTVTAIRQLGTATNLITLNQSDEAVLLMYRSGAWGLSDNISYVEPIYFSGTNAAANAAASRTNLGLGELNNPRFVQIRIGDTNISFESALEDEGINWSFVRGTNASEPAITIGYLSNSILSFLPVQFQSNSHAATTRTNLGLGLPALTNTNNATFQEAIFTTNAAPTNAGNFGDHVAWMGVSIVTNGVTNVFKIPLYK